MRRFWLIAVGFLLAGNYLSQACRADSMPGQPFTQTITGSDVKFDMMPIPAGTFMMGSPDSEVKRKKDEGPQVQVKMDAFYMGKTTVTQAEYTLFLSNYQRLASAGAPIIP